MKKILFIIALTFFSYRWIFFYHYDPTYFKDFYEHSQWSIPLSPRVMGDAELYQYSGYRLATGDDLFHINPETPPIGKYAYGFSELWFRNPYYASALFYLVTVGFFWCFARQVLADAKAVWLSLFFFCTSPLLFSQIGQVGLDLPQLCFLLIHLVFLFLAAQIPSENSGKNSFAKTKNAAAIFTFLLISGVGLGAFTATKIALFTPVIMVVDGWFLWQQKKLKYILPILGATVLTYVLAFLPYFFAHHTFIEWLKAEKWVVQFYRDSRVQFIPLMIFISLVSGVFLTWWDGWTYIREWTVLWLVSLVILLTQVVRKDFWQTLLLRKLEKTPTQRSQTDFFSQLKWKFVVLLSLSLILTNSIIPFWPRYLILVLPFLILLTVKFLLEKFVNKKLKPTHRKILIVAVILIIFEFGLFLFPQPNEIKGYISDDWQNGSYAELYTFVDPKTQSQISRNEFVNTLQVVDHQLESQQKTLKIPNSYVWPWQNSVTKNADISYQTPNGPYHFTIPVKMTREHNQWRIAWNWADVLPQFKPGDQVVVDVQPVRRSSLFTHDGTLLSRQDHWPFISVVPNNLKNSEHVIDLLTALTPLQGPNIRTLFFVNSPGEKSIPVGFVKPEYDPTTLVELEKEPGVTVQNEDTRVYNPSVIDFSPLKMVRDIESKHPELEGQNGVTISVSSVEVYHQDAKPSQDVILPKSFFEMFGRGM